MNSSEIIRKVKFLVRKYKTRDPFVIAEEMGIIVVRSPLTPNVRGFFTRQMRRRIIVVDANLPPRIQSTVCAHELAHAIYHDGRTPIDLYFSWRGKPGSESYSDFFAAELTISDEDTQRYKYMNMEHVIDETGLDKEAIEHRLRGCCMFMNPTFREMFSSAFGEIWKD